MPRHTPSPLDLPEPEPDFPEAGADAALGWTSAVILVAVLLLAFANAVSLRDWIDEQPPSPLQAEAAALADQWVAISRGIGFGAPRDALHGRWKQIEGARFADGGVVAPVLEDGSLGGQGDPVRGQGDTVPAASGAGRADQR